MHRTALVPLLLTAGCSFVRQAEFPMASTFHAAPAAEPDSLIVLLPGLGDMPEDYEARGIVAAIQRTNPAFDVIAADAHFGYYRTRTFLERLRTDVIAPVAGRYRHIWLMGISLGGFGSAIYALENPGEIEGLILLAPYMGDGDAISSVAAAGGLANWRPSDPSEIEGDGPRKFHELWTWYRGYVTDPASMPKLYLGYGTEDSLHVANGFVAEVLPANQWLTMPGGHKWTVWEPLFDELVVRALAR